MPDVAVPSTVEYLTDTATVVLSLRVIEKLAALAPGPLSMAEVSDMLTLGTTGGGGFAPDPELPPPPQADSADANTTNTSN